MYHGFNIHVQLNTMVFILFCEQYKHFPHNSDFCYRVALKSHQRLCHGSCIRRHQVSGFKIILTISMSCSIGTQFLKGFVFNLSGLGLIASITMMLNLYLIKYYFATGTHLHFLKPCCQYILLVFWNHQTIPSMSVTCGQCIIQLMKIIFHLLACTF